jgi:hypothetical protein
LQYNVRESEFWDGRHFFNGENYARCAAMGREKKMSREHIVNNLCKHKMLRLRVLPLDRCTKKDNQPFSRKISVIV